MSSRVDAVASTSSDSPFEPIQAGTSLMLAWRLLNRPVLLVGGGGVATGRLQYLLEAGAKVTLIAPREGLSDEVLWRIEGEKRAEGGGEIIWKDRVWVAEEDEPGLGDFDLVLTAIPVVALSLHIASLCRTLHTPVNAADLPPSCDFYFGSQVRRGPLQIMVSTSGRGPRIAALVRKRIEASLPPNVENAITRVGQLRFKLREIVPEAGGAVGKRRMAWMIEVCDLWTLDEFAEMDEEMMEKVLQGWEKGEVKSFQEVSGGRKIPSRVGGALEKKVVEWRKEGWVGMLGGFVGGLVVGVVAAKRFGLLEGRTG